VRGSLSLTALEHTNQSRRRNSGQFATDADGGEGAPGAGDGAEKGGGSGGDDDDEDEGKKKERVKDGLELLDGRIKVGLTYASGHRVRIWGTAKAGEGGRWYDAELSLTDATGEGIESVIDDDDRTLHAGAGHVKGRAADGKSAAKWKMSFALLGNRGQDVGANHSKPGACTDKDGSQGSVHALSGAIRQAGAAPIRRLHVVDLQASAHYLAPRYRYPAGQLLQVFVMGGWRAARVLKGGTIGSNDHVLSVGMPTFAHPQAQAQAQAEGPGMEAWEDSPTSLPTIHKPAALEGDDEAAALAAAAEPDAPTYEPGADAEEERAIVKAAMAGAAAAAAACVPVAMAAAAEAAQWAATRTITASLGALNHRLSTLFAVDHKLLLPLPTHPMPAVDADGFCEDDYRLQHGEMADDWREQEAAAAAALAAAQLTVGARLGGVQLVSALSQPAELCDAGERVRVRHQGGYQWYPGTATRVVSSNWFVLQLSSSPAQQVRDIKVERTRVAKGGKKKRPIPQKQSGGSKKKSKRRLQKEQEAAEAAAAEAAAAEAAATGDAAAKATEEEHGFQTPVLLRPSPFYSLEELVSELELKLNDHHLGAPDSSTVVRFSVSTCTSTSVLVKDPQAKQWMEARHARAVALQALLGEANGGGGGSGGGGGGGGGGSGPKGRRTPAGARSPSAGAQRPEIAKGTGGGGSAEAEPSAAEAAAEPEAAPVPRLRITCGAPFAFNFAHSPGLDSSLGFGAARYGTEEVASFRILAPSAAGCNCNSRFTIDTLFGANQFSIRVLFVDVQQADTDDTGDQAPPVPSLSLGGGGGGSGSGSDTTSSSSSSSSSESEDETPDESQWETHKVLLPPGDYSLPELAIAFASAINLGRIGVRFAVQVVGSDGLPPMAGLAGDRLLLTAAEPFALDFRRSHLLPAQLGFDVAAFVSEAAPSFVLTAPEPCVPGHRLGYTRSHVVPSRAFDVQLDAPLEYGTGELRVAYEPGSVLRIRTEELDRNRLSESDEDDSDEDGDADDAEVVGVEVDAAVEAEAAAAAAAAAAAVEAEENAKVGKHVDSKAPAEIARRAAVGAAAAAAGALAAQRVREEDTAERRQLEVERAEVEKVVAAAYKWKGGLRVKCMVDETGTDGGSKSGEPEVAVLDKVAKIVCRLRAAGRGNACANHAPELLEAEELAAEGLRHARWLRVRHGALRCALSGRLLPLSLQFVPLEPLGHSSSAAPGGATADGPAPPLAAAVQSQVPWGVVPPLPPLPRNLVPIGAGQRSAPPLADWLWRTTMRLAGRGAGVCIFGPAASGKSTLLRQLLAHHLANALPPPKKAKGKKKQKKKKQKKKAPTGVGIEGQEDGEEEEEEQEEAEEEEEETEEEEEEQPLSVADNLNAAIAETAAAAPSVTPVLIDGRRWGEAIKRHCLAGDLLDAFLQVSDKRHCTMTH
jgi:hypothetical protein